MSRKYTPHYADPKGTVAEKPGVGIYHAVGITVPADGTAGYAPGCIFQDTDAAAGSQFFINEGTLASCDFNVIALGGLSLAGLTATAAEINARAAAASRVVTVTDATTYAVLAANSGKIHIVPDLTASCTLTLPTAANGLEYTFVSKAVAIDAHDWIFSTGGANFFLGGLAFADTDAGAGADEIAAGVFGNGSSNDFMTIVTPGGGTRIYLVCDGTNWIVNGLVFSATTPAFSDT